MMFDLQLKTYQAKEFDLIIEILLFKKLRAQLDLTIIINQLDVFL